MTPEEQIEAAYEAAGWGGEEYRAQRPPLADHIRWLKKQIQYGKEANERIVNLLEGKTVKYMGSEFKMGKTPDLPSSTPEIHSTK